MTLYQGDHSNEYLLSEMKDGKVEGRCQLFNRGILSLAWMMKDGKRIGQVTGFENGNISAVMDGDLDGFINAYLKASSLGQLQK